jgi:4a-hydroxytetrahydrobiopterin dehydratase
MGKYRTLTAAEIAVELAGLEIWRLADNRIEAEIVLPGFREAVGFVLQLAFIAEALDHHPEITISYNKVRIRTCTHDAGNKITDRDIELARQITVLTLGPFKAWIQDRI